MVPRVFYIADIGGTSPIVPVAASASVRVRRPLLVVRSVKPPGPIIAFRAVVLWEFSAPGRVVASLSHARQVDTLEFFSLHFT